MSLECEKVSMWAICKSALHIIRQPSSLSTFSISVKYGRSTEMSEPEPQGDKPESPDYFPCVLDLSLATEVNDFFIEPGTGGGG